MPALSLRGSPQPPENAEWEHSPTASSRLLETHRQKLEVEVQQARTIIAPDEANDDQDLPTEETLNRAIAFLRTHMNWVWRSRGTLAPVPTIGPGPSGSVDLYWRTPYWKLLVNIPASNGALATFYGDDYNRQKTKGSLDPDALSIPIIAWLTA